jgi:hypothetical protein
MARPSKQTVDYFPHYVHHGKTMFILEARWGNDGYAGIYKVMEILGDEPGQYYDARKPTSGSFWSRK